MKVGYHSYIQLPIPHGEKSVIEKCACGAVRKRFVSGGMTYKQPDGTFASKRAEADQHCSLFGTKKMKFSEVTPDNFKPKVFDCEKMSEEAITARTEPLMEQPINILKANPKYLPNGFHNELMQVKSSPIGAAAKSETAISIAKDHAALRDAYLAINIMYEEMVAHGLRTKGRYLAGRILYSNGYTEKVKHLDGEHARIMGGN